MSTVVCPRCGAAYPVRGGGHCMACHRTFSSDSSAAAHRAGPHDARTCIDVTSTPPWRLTARGWTHHPEREWTQ